MKQHIFSKGGLLLAFMSVFLSFFACQQDQFMDNSPPNEGAVFKQSAKQFYENALMDLRKANIDKAKTDARLTALDFLPDWSAAILHTRNGKTCLEIPIELSWNSTIESSASSAITKFNPVTDILIPIRLIISKSDQESFDADFIIIQSDFPYSNGEIPKFNLYNKIDNFTGREYLFNLDGSFDKGWRHKEGKIVNTLVKITNDIRQPPLGTRLCTSWWLVDSQGRPIRQLTEWECLGFDGGALGTGIANSSGTNGTLPPNWGSTPTPDCTGNSGNTCPNFATLHFARYDIDEDTYVSLGSMIYSHSITVTNCPLRQYYSDAITYVQKTKLGFPGVFQSSNHVTKNGPAEPIDPLQPRGGFRTYVNCKANATFTLWSGPWGGIPFNEDLDDDSAYFVR